MYLIGILAAFISPASHALSNIFDAYIVGNIFKKAATTIFYANMTNILGVLPLLLIGPIHFIPLDIAPYIVLIGLINLIYLFPYYKALKIIDTSIVAALFSLEKIFIPFWAYMIVNEILQPSQYLGLGIIIIASLVLNIKDRNSIKINKGFWLMLLTAVMLSFENVFYKKALQQTDWISAAFWSETLTYVLTWFILLNKPIRQDIIKNFPEYKTNIGKFCFIEIFDRLGSFTSIFALSILPILVQQSISSTQPIFVIVYGFIFTKLFGKHLNESITRKEIIKKLICFIFIGIGVNLAIGL